MITATKPLAASTASPVPSPVANLSTETQEGSGWCNDQDNRPKPLRNKFSDLKTLDCQVYSDSMSHLSRVVEDDDTDPPPTPRSHEEKLRVITNIICARPGEILLLLNSSVRKALLEELVVKKRLCMRQNHLVSSLKTA